jgi:hypothetical protein
MTAAERVRSTRRWLAILAGVRAIGWAGAVLFGALAIGAGLAALTPLPPLVRAGVPWLAALLCVATLGMFAWRERFVWSSRHVALWLEERAPALRYALVTAVDPRYAQTVGPLLEPAIARVDTRVLVRDSARRTLLPALAALSAAALTFAVIPPAMRAALAGAHSTGGAGPATELPSRLAPLRGTLTPPAYAVDAGVRSQTLDEPTSIAGLAGSRVVIMGPGTPDGIEARVGEMLVGVTAAAPGHDTTSRSTGATQGAEWRLAFTLPDSATALRLDDRHHRRLIVLDPQRDEPPLVQLVLPASDTTLRTPSGSLTLQARITDDFGITAARFEYIVSSGEGEGSFTSREGMLGARAFARVKEGELRLTIPFSTFQLQPGDQLSVRAVAIDNNTFSGPDTGYSEPRTIRIARPGEYDSLAVEGAPPATDTAVATLRYIIQASEELQAERPRLPREKFVARSRDLGRRVERLRTRVQELQSERTLGGMLPPNPLLSEAYMGLVEGGAALLIAEPGEALPHLWKALRALQKFAWAERYYLRGRSPDVLVDLARVRLSGTDTGRATPRSPRAAADSTRMRLRREYTQAVRSIATSPDSAAEHLLLLQVEALRTDPALATALGEAVAALRAGSDPARALRAARRLLDGAHTATDTLPRWSGAW